MKNLIFIGAGGHAKSVADSINKSEYELCGFIDSKKKGTHRLTNPGYRTV